MYDASGTAVCDTSAMSDRETLYLVDGPNMAFRAFFAIGGMTNAAGQPTNALFGFTNMLLKLIRDEQPDYLAVTWDPKGGSFRDRVFPEYKGTRAEMPADLVPQIPLIRQLLELFGIPCLELPGYEADDIIGTLAVQAGSMGIKTVILKPKIKILMADVMRLIAKNQSAFMMPMTSIWGFF